LAQQFNEEEIDVADRLRKVEKMRLQARWIDAWPWSSLTEPEAFAFLTLAYIKDTELAAICRKKLRAVDTEGVNLFQYAATWAVFRVEEDNAIELLLNLCAKGSSAGVSARRCLERLSFQPTPASIIASGPESVAAFWREWAASNNSSTWGDRFVQECRERNETITAKSVQEISDGDLVNLWFPKKLSTTRSYRIVDIPPLSNEDLFLMRLSEILSDRHPKCIVSPADFPLGYPDFSWSQWVTSGGNTSWKRELNLE